MRFNAFLAALLDPVSLAIEQMAYAPGLIIHLRATPAACSSCGLVDLLVDEPDLIWTYNTPRRTRTDLCRAH
jgi:hypothetical protein